MGERCGLLNLTERVYARAQLEMGFKPQAIFHGLNRAASTVKRERGCNGAQRPARSHDDS